MSKKITCPTCGARVEAGTLEQLGNGRIRCPDCIDVVLVEDERVREVVDKIEREANSHGSNYAAGMRLARNIVEQEMLAMSRGEDE